MDGRYEVFATHGKGVFSTVLRARDQQGGEGGSPSEVAIKMIRANETMSKAAQTEKVLLLIRYHEACQSLLPISFTGSGITCLLSVLMLVLLCPRAASFGAQL